MTNDGILWLSTLLEADIKEDCILWLEVLVLEADVIKDSTCGAAAGTKVSAVTGRGDHKDGGLLGSEHAGQKNARGPEEATGPRDAPRPWGSPGPPSHRHPSPPPPKLRRQSQ
ncbi:hypothetical protein I79_011864 [Cricetulus griseus]|uniref:Uncharacterized protein n=1 Tax=Cricetulus griseus TaxID=10029 RepID=G3HMB3_CRIGR|nr:hypothetical protein I79_011864 [Cricetulus griseus]